VAGSEAREARGIERYPCYSCFHNWIPCTINKEYTNRCCTFSICDVKFVYLMICRSAQEHKPAGPLCP